VLHYFIRRLLWACVLFVAVTLVTFVNRKPLGWPISPPALSDSWFAVMFSPRAALRIEPPELMGFEREERGFEPREKR